ncbi:MAG: CDP-diacylglycerol O-phosphatidyltransferase [Deltaproteobacteria bacterium]|jgi:phosphatidylcholine synthase|nr:CDP-diacylglycerol O-phosphatidyltransferase [Deltaproteobacteria bacterium]
MNFEGPRTERMPTTASAVTSGRRRVLRACAWAVHCYTAAGGAAGLWALYFASFGRFRESFLAMAVALAIDSTDGSLARLVGAAERVPELDGALLDNIVDYLTYVAAPVLLMLRAGVVPADGLGLMLGSAVMMASGYGFSRRDAKTSDHYFRGFPSYWNVVAFYLYYLELAPHVNLAIVGFLTLAVLAPVSFIYPSRTAALRGLTLVISTLWGLATFLLVLFLPRRHPALLALSLASAAYYLLASLALGLRGKLSAPTGTGSCN